MLCWCMHNSQLPCCSMTPECVMQLKANCLCFEHHTINSVLRNISYFHTFSYCWWSCKLWYLSMTDCFCSISYIMLIISRACTHVSFATSLFKIRSHGCMTTFPLVLFLSCWIGQTLNSKSLTSLLMKPKANKIYGINMCWDLPNQSS